MRHMYDTTQPRLTIISQDRADTYDQCSREIGQAEAMGEAMFWCSIGYRVEVSRWNGKFFETSENIYPEDL